MGSRRSRDYANDFFRSDFAHRHLDELRHRMEARDRFCRRDLNAIADLHQIPRLGSIAAVRQRDEQACGRRQTKRDGCVPLHDSSTRIAPFAAILARRAFYRRARFNAATRDDKSPATRDRE